MEKRLYIVSSLHFGDTPEMNKSHNLIEILETRLELVAGIARASKQGTYFSDGVPAEMAASFNDAMNNLDPKELASNLVEMFLHRPFDTFYDLSRNALLLAQLREQGVNYSYAPGEIGYEDELPALIFQRMFPTLEDAQEFSRNSHDPDYMQSVSDNVMRIRDENFLENVMEYGSEHNILFVGRDHEMICLQNAPIEWYRVNVLYDDGVMSVEGRLPSGFEKNIRLPEKTGTLKPVKLSIKYS